MTKSPMFKALAALAVALFTCALGTVWTTGAVNGQVPPEIVKPQYRKPDPVFRLPAIPLVKSPIDERVLGVAFTSDGKRLITAGARDQQPGQVIAWDLTSGKALGHTRGIRGTRGIALSPDDQTLACGEFGGIIRLRDPISGKETGALKGHSVGVNSLAFNTDGSMLASAGLDRVVKVWDMKSKNAKKTLIGHQGMVFSVAFFLSGKAIVTGSEDKTAIIWDLETESPKFTLKLDNGVETVVVSPDDKFVVTGSWDGKIGLWDAATGTEVGAFPHDRSGIYALAFSPDGQTLAAGGTNSLVHLYAMETRQPYGAQGRHAGPVWALAFSPDGTTLASGSEDRLARLWDVAALKKPGGETKVPPQDISPKSTLDAREFKAITALAVSADGTQVATITSEGQVQVRDSLTGIMKARIAGRRRTSLAYAPDSLLLAIGDDEGTVRLCDTATGKDLQVFKSEGGAAQSVAFSPDGKFLASGNVNTKIYVWDVAKPGSVQVVLEGHKAPVMSLAFAPESGGLASGDQAGTLKYWDIKSGKETASQEAHPGGPCVVAYASTGVLASAGSDGALQLWDALLNRKQNFRVPSAVSAMAFSRDGKLLVSGTQIPMLIAWNPESGEPLQQFGAHPGGVTGLALDARDNSLLSGGADGGLLRWQSVTSDLPVPVTVAPPQKATAQPSGDFYHDFRGAKPLPAVFKVQNYENQASLTAEKEGLRITLPAERQRTDRVGLKLPMNLAGDFEVTVGFEILNVALPIKGNNGVGLNVILAREGAGESVSFERNKRPNGDDVLLSAHQTTSPEGKAQWKTKQQPSTMTSGQLRIVRIGGEVTYWAAEGNSNSFRKVDISQYSTVAINTIFLAAYPGFSQNSVDVRLKDLRVRQTAIAQPTNVGSKEKFTEVINTGEVPDAKAPAAFYERRWFLLSVAFFAILLCSAGCLWIVRRRRNDEEVAPAPSSPIVVACAQCEQKLKVRAELLGRKVKCPRCGRAVLVTTT
jgi:WD40 repeat protein